MSDQNQPEQIQMGDINQIAGDITGRRIEFKAKSTNPLINPLSYKQGEKQSGHEKFFKIPLFVQYRELYKHPFNKGTLGTFYSRSYNASLEMCKQVSSLNPELDIDNYDKYRVKAGVEDEIEHKKTEFLAECMNENLNLYFDTIQHLVISYGNCRDACGEKHVYREGKFFDNSTSDPCLKKCKKFFFLTMGRTNDYFARDYGFYIENSDTYF
ncbi:unnamed protein product [Moneuplotes crassus]|uniref:Uncharacterized protein n=1 Tax=Euplotes crassus TaxID=5936 RepID=A0AAD2D463_EUPCR|nr:unnamed protein product [Moneuplotes crassus]